MPLTDQEKHEAAINMATLVELGEPEALLGMLRRVAQSRARLDPGLIHPDEAQRWLNLANALANAEQTIEHDNQPKQDPASGYRQSAARQTTNAEMAQNHPQED